MASISATSTLHTQQRSPINGGGTCIGQKRRIPIDPDGHHGASQYDDKISYSSQQQPSAKRPRTIDDVIGSLSLRAPDPPGNFSGSKRKNDGDVMSYYDNADMQPPYAKVPRSELVSSVNGSDNSTNQQHQPMEPLGRKGDPSNSAASELFQNSTNQLDQQSISKNNAYYTATTSSTSQLQHNECMRRQSSSDMREDSTMSIDGSNDSDCDSSVSESSIRNAMYQVVFGRQNSMNNPHISPSLLTANGSSGDANAYGSSTYDTVDSKIEDLIRRSRLQATIKSQKEKNGVGANNDNDGMEVDDDDIQRADAYDDDDDDWNPGHG